MMEALAERLHLQDDPYRDDPYRDAARLAGRGCTSTQQHKLCAVSASCAKLLGPPTPLSDRAQCMARLRGMLPVSRSAGASLTPVLRLAAVCLLHIPLAVCRLCMAKRHALRAGSHPNALEGSDGFPPMPLAGVICMYATPASLQPAPFCSPSEALSIGAN